MREWLSWAALALGWAPTETRRQRIADLEAVRDGWLELQRRRG